METSQGVLSKELAAKDAKVLEDFCTTRLPVPRSNLKYIPPQIFSDKSQISILLSSKFDKFVLHPSIRAAFLRALLGMLELHKIEMLARFSFIFV